MSYNMRMRERYSVTVRDDGYIPRYRGVSALQFRDTLHVNERTQKTVKEMELGQIN